MMQIAVIPAQTTTGSILEIIVLLVIAGLIAWLTAYYYYRSIYNKKREELENIIHSRDEMISYLEKKKNSLLLNITELEKEKENQMIEIARLKSEADKKANDKNKL